MKALDIRLPADSEQIRSVCGFMGSFDPIHKGHEWIITKLIESYEIVLLMIPVIHFEKHIRFPLNATFEQRMKMLNLRCKDMKDRVITGIAHEVLFLRLADALTSIFPNAEITFGMGNDTFSRFLLSKSYYEKMGLTWNHKEASKLERLKKKIIIFGRSAHHADYIPVPENVRLISSTQVRQTVAALQKQGASADIWKRTLEKMISPDILEFVRTQGLYQKREG